jgi:hypothetical protein
MMMSMNKHLQDARLALQRQPREGSAATQEKLIKAHHEAIEAMLKYLEELDSREKAS